MKLYTIRYVDSLGVPRIESFFASSAVEAFEKIKPAEGEHVESVIERC